MAMELMSPAGSAESVIAAVRGGADAVYFGTGNFNARRNAKNLEGDELTDAIRYCRLRGVKTYVTMNTLVTDRELERAKETVLLLYKLGVDALIVQDLGMARLIRSVAPEMPIHASTQMTVHNLGGVLECVRLGFSRVVLSREVPLSEMAYICKNSPIEIEVFVHGALCMCYSGQCYLSAAIGGRSGNRGLCAQPCRMGYALPGERMSYPLSLKDLSLAEHLHELEEIGVHTLKIEGRMKRPEYVAMVTQIYKRAITEHHSPTSEELEQLRMLFSRDGFTDGYFTGRKGAQMFGIRSEDNGKTAKTLYKQAQNIYLSEPEPACVPVTMRFSAKKDASMQLQVECEDGSCFETEGSVPEVALRRATSPEEIRSALEKTGGTVFLPKEVQVELDPGLRASAASINAMRRQCLAGLSSVRRMAPERRIGEWNPVEETAPCEQTPGLILSFRSAEQLSGRILRSGAEMFWLPLNELSEKADMIRALCEQDHNLRFAAVLDRVIFDGHWQDTLRKLRRVRGIGIRDLVVTNLGQLALVRKLDFELHGDFGLNVMNSQTVAELKKLGLSSCTLSFEMNLAQIRDMRLTLDSQLIVYGRLPLMITENRIGGIRTAEAEASGKPLTMTDKTGRAFPLIPEAEGRTTILNAEPLWLADKEEDLQALHLRWVRMCFTTESPREIEQILRAYSAEERMPRGYTRGLYYRGVQ